MGIECKLTTPQNEYLGLCQRNRHQHSLQEYHKSMDSREYQVALLIRIGQSLCNLDRFVPVKFDASQPEASLTKLAAFCDVRPISPS
jgi:hypothetical protein